MFKQNAVPQIPENWPKFGNTFTRALGRLVIGIFGWKIIGKYPETNRLVVAVAPHTSNWDFVIGLSCKFAMGFKTHWLGKHSIFIWPFNGLLRSLGGIPVVRHAASNMVEQVAARFEGDEAFVLTVAPEGTRKQVSKLKTGFLRIAIAAKVPVFMIAFDYEHKHLILGELYLPTGDLETDEQYIREYFMQYQGKYPEQYCP